jgi:hypothetical protein
MFVRFVTALLVALALLPALPPTKVESDGTTLTLPLCTECRQALKRRSAPASLPGDDGPYWYEDSLWARTFFGTTGDDLAAAVSQGELRR